MKFKMIFAGLSALVCIFSSCIKEEAPNAEADILSCTLPDESMLSAEVNVGLPYDYAQEAYPIYISVKEGVDITALAPEFTLTEGATIEPASGSVQNLSSPVRYTVTSEDRNWQRVYSVLAYVDAARPIPDSYHFETVSSAPGYDVFTETGNGVRLTWESGNAGFKMSAGGAGREAYPTSQADNGVEGKCVKLTTCSTGSLGALVGMPIAAGNIFFGQFNVSAAMSNPLAATQFGIKCNRKPLKMSGYYRYEPGEQLQDGKENIDGTDEMDIYAVFYENTDAFGRAVMLDGNISRDNFIHPQMVALARIEDHGAKSEWTRFELEFDYGRYGKSVDETRLSAGGYNIAIVMSSSIGGASFRGAVGSTLYVDEIELVFE